MTADEQPRDRLPELASRHVEDRSTGGARRGPLPDESFTYPCARCQKKAQSA